ncbi:MAG: crossover junction endodeoxyribonuclease RuvC [Rubricoccaceae bacterium]
MIVLGLDPGTRHTGFGVVAVEGRRERALDYGAIHLPEGLDHALRLRRIYDGILGVIDRLHPEACAVEMPVFAGNAQAMLKLGRAQAALMLAAVHRELPVAQYTPAEIKKAVVGSGRGSKEQIWFMVRAQLGLTEDRGPDAADALAAALCHARRLREGPPVEGPPDGPRPSAVPARDWAAFVAANPGRVRR